MRLLVLLILPGLCAAQSPKGDSLPPPVIRSARAPDLTVMLRRLESARSREDEPELRHLAQKFAERAQAHPSDAESFYAAARTHDALLNLYVLQRQKDKARQQLDLALPMIDRAIALEPLRAEAFALRAQLFGWKVGLANPLTRPLRGMKYGSRIEEDLDQARKLDPRSPALQISMGMEDYYRPAAFGGNLERAAACFRRALEYDSSNPEAWTWLGLALKGLKKDEEAKRAFQEVLRLDPENARAARELASLE